MPLLLMTPESKMLTGPDPVTRMPLVAVIVPLFEMPPAKVLTLSMEMPTPPRAPS